MEVESLLDELEPELESELELCAISTSGASRWKTTWSATLESPSATPAHNGELHVPPATRCGDHRGAHLPVGPRARCCVLVLPAEARRRTEWC